jgi:hypothetical protein
MSRTRRILRALIVAAAVGSIVAGPAIAAPKPAKGPAFSVSLNRDGYSAAGQQYVAMTFTSTSDKASRGFAQAAVPAKQHPTLLFWSFFSWLQSADPTIAGYVRVEATSCASATLHSLTTGLIVPVNTVAAIPTIEVAFDCRPGQSFVIHWFTNLGYTGYVPGTLDAWDVQVATRKDATARWAPQASSTIRVNSVNLVLPPLPFITPPLQLVAAVPIISAPEEPPTQWLLTGDAIFLDQNVTSQITINRIFRADTGAELVMVDAYDFRVDQGGIQVIDCIDINLVTGVDVPPGVVPYDFSSDCDDIPEVLQIMPNPGSVANADGTLLSSQTAVIVGVFDFFTAPNVWKAAESRCLFRGGIYHEHANVDELWTCTLPTPAPNNDRYFFVANDLGQALYCPTGRIRNDASLIERQIIACIP